MQFATVYEIFRITAEKTNQSARIKSTMILQIYHCNLVIIKDKRGSKSSKARSTRPTGIERAITEVSESDIHFLPPTEHFITVKGHDYSGQPIIQREELLGRFLAEFQEVQVFDQLGNEFIRIEWEALAKKLGVSMEELERVKRVAKERGLLFSLGINYNLQKWLQHSVCKGAFVVMTCIEDLDYSNINLANQFALEIAELRDAMINPKHGDFFNTVFVVPNVHIADTERVGQRHNENRQILEACCEKLRKLHFHVQLNSYGWAKTIFLGIVGHQAGGFVRRTIHHKDGS